MKQQQLSPLQLSFLIGNFIFSGTIISIQQIIIEISKQNSWVVVILTFLITVGILLLVCSNQKKIEKMKGLFEPENQTWFHKIFVSFFLIFLVFIFIRDFRSLNGFIDTILLPDTPIDILAILTIIVLIYVSLTGIEVIARITVIHFFTVIIIVVALPLMLLNEVSFSNAQPIGGVNSLSEILKSSYILFAWLAEVIVIVFLLIFVNPLTHLRKAGLIGATLGFILIFILVTMNIAVLGVAVASEATYPNIALIQQINLTDFLDRLDLVIVVVWLPTMFCKLGFLLFGIQKLLSVLRGRESDASIVPLAIILGLTIHLFKSNIDAIEYSFFTWPTKGLILEGIIVMLFLAMKYKPTLLKKSSSKNKDAKA